MLLTRASLGACYKANTGETMQPRTQIGYGVLVCLRRKQPNTLRLTSRAFRGINRRCRYTFIAEQRKRKSLTRTPFQVFDLGFHWRALRSFAPTGQSTSCPNSLPPQGATNSSCYGRITKPADGFPSAGFVARPKELESLTFGSVDQRSIQLS